MEKKIKKLIAEIEAREKDFNEIIKSGAHVNYWMGRLFECRTLKAKIKQILNDERNNF